MPKKKGKRGKKPTRGKTEQREHTQKSKRSVGSDELSTFSNLSIFRDDLLEQILVYLSIASIIRAGLVCKKWRKITSSKRFLWNASQTMQQKPWYFIYVGNFFTRTTPTWYAYDPILQKCQGGDFLDMMKSHMSFDSSDGLVCFVKDNEIHVCNPITKEHKKLHEPPRTCLYHHRRLINIWVNRRLQNYNVSVLDYEVDAHLNVEFSFQVYDSATMKWATSQPEILIGWTLDRKSVICNGVLYFLIYSTGGGPIKDGLLAYNFSSNSSTHGTLINSFIPLPCSMIFGLMNLKEKLIVVGAIDKPGVENLHIGFGIWLLKGKDWQEISRITRPCFYNSYGHFDSSGADDLIYIHNKVDPELVVFDMNRKQWTCCQDCPLEYMTTGFCFQPRLDIQGRTHPQSTPFHWRSSTFDLLAAGPGIGALRKSIRKIRESRDWNKSGSVAVACWYFSHILQISFWYSSQVTVAVGTPATFCKLRSPLAIGILIFIPFSIFCTTCKWLWLFEFCWRFAAANVALLNQRLSLI